MVSLSESSRNAAMISASIVVAAAILGAAQAATENIYRYSTPKTGYYAIDNTDLSPDGTNSLAYLNEWDVALRPDENKDGCFNTGVHLPHGAVISQVRVFYQATAGAQTSFVRIERKAYSTGVNEVVTEGQLPDSADRVGVNIPLNASLSTVNNGSFSYGFGICLRNDTDMFYAARIRYTYDTAGD
jgi:hypothetical protein